MQNTILDTEVTTIDGKVTSLQPYSGNVLLIVNVASKMRTNAPIRAAGESAESLASAGLHRPGVPLQPVSGPGTGQ